jgi:hypothetical protein
MSVLQRLLKLHDLKEWIEPEWSFYAVKTPIVTFTNFVHIPKGGDRLLHVTLRGDFDNQDVVLYLRETIAVEAIPDPGEIVKVRLRTSVKGRFSHALLLGAQYHDVFRVRDPGLNEMTVETFPIHNSEFAGCETPKEVRVLRRDFVSTVDWSRDISPRIRMRFANPVTKGGSIGKKLGLAKLSVLVREIENLSGVRGGWIEVENFESKRLRIESIEVGNYRVLGLDGDLIMEDTTERVILALHAFATGD